MTNRYIGGLPESSRRRLQITVLIGLLSTLPLPSQSQTKEPSDVFFTDQPSNYQEYQLDQQYSGNIVARNVVVRGWLTSDPSVSGCGQVSAAVSVNCGKAGISDVHYELVLDPEFIASTYGTNPGVLTSAMLPGHGPDGDNLGTPIPLKNPPGGYHEYADSSQEVWLANTVSGIDINSFWLPTNEQGMPPLPLQIHTELNAWHTRGSYVGCWLGTTWLGCSAHNYTARGPAPYPRPFPKDYQIDVSSNAIADTWWPFDPDNPDGGNTPLQPGDYVEIRGTLWQDIKHSNDGGTVCWGEAFHNQDGYLEIHPVDSLTRVPGPGPTPMLGDPNIDPVGSAQAGVKRVLAVTLCSDAKGAANGQYWTVCPENTYSGLAPPANRTPQELDAYVEELVDGRFTNVPVGPGGMAHSASVQGDCVRIVAYWLAGLKWAHYKASYVVWWTPQLTLPNPVQVGLAQLSAAACPTTDGKTCTSDTYRPPNPNLMDLITVTVAGAPIAGTTISVLGQNRTATTNASGIAVISYPPCYRGEVPKIGETNAPARVPIPCKWTATASKGGYRDFRFSLP